MDNGPREERPLDAGSMTYEQAVVWLRQQPGQEAFAADCYFDDPIERSAERFRLSGEWQAVRRLLRGRPPGEALDLGAGRGMASYAFARDGWRVTAVEPDPSPIVGAAAVEELARRTGVSLRVVRAFGEQLPMSDESFDLVYCRQVLHHARDLQRLLGEVRRVLKPGGLFLATREHVISRQEDLGAFLEAHPLHRLFGGEHAYQLAEYRRAFGSAGLRLVRTLAPFDSDINMHPRSRSSLRPRKDLFGVRFRLRVLRKNLKSDAPGRLYSFVSVRPR